MVWAQRKSFCRECLTKPAKPVGRVGYMTAVMGQGSWVMGARTPFMVMRQGSGGCWASTFSLWAGPSRWRWMWRMGMGALTTIELKAFVPARDFELSKRFYQDLGFTMSWCDNDLAY